MAGWCISVPPSAGTGIRPELDWHVSWKAVPDVSRGSNNFDLLRLVLASMVVLTHCLSCSREPSISWLRYAAGPVGFGGAGLVAVEGFFAISGYLVVASYERSGTTMSYLSKRARRILPGYWGALVFALLLGALLSTLPARAFFSSSGTWKFAAANLSFANFLHPLLPGLFTDNPKDSLVNGPLWTIKIEVMFYLAVPLLVAACRRFGKWQTLAALFAASVIFRVGFQHFHQRRLAQQLPGQLSFFLVGTVVYYYHRWFHRNARWMWLATGLSALAVLLMKWTILQTISIPLAVMCVAVLAPHIASPTQWFGDLSYGTYVLHYPVVQGLVSLGLFHAHPKLAVAITIVTVAALALASWNLIERRFLIRNEAVKPLQEPARRQVLDSI
jgi:peptidoglycan/LPS O-acetylase OafA/YrhL